MTYVDYFGLSSTVDEGCGCTQHGHPGWHNAPQGCICGKDGNGYVAGSYQRCTVHKDRNIQNHLPKRYRQEAPRRFRNTIDCISYQDAKEELTNLEKWLERINPSAAQSLTECTEELLTVHRLNVPPLLRRTLHSTNPIESMFSQVSTKMGRIKVMKKGKMVQRWIAAALLEQRSASEQSKDTCKDLGKVG